MNKPRRFRSPEEGSYQPFNDGELIACWECKGAHIFIHRDIDWRDRGDGQLTQYSDLCLRIYFSGSREMREEIELWVRLQEKSKNWIIRMCQPVLEGDDESTVIVSIASVAGEFGPTPKKEIVESHIVNPVGVLLLGTDFLIEN